MAERDSAAVHVELLVRDAELARRREHLRRERLVQLHEVDVVDPEAGAVERFPRGRHRADPHVRGSTPATPLDTTRASGSRPRSRARSSEQTATQAAPSLICDALPAVTV